MTYIQNQRASSDLGKSLENPTTNINCMIY